MGFISRVTVLITHIRGLITPLITTHEPPSKSRGLREAERACDSTDMCHAIEDLFAGCWGSLGVGLFGAVGHEALEIKIHTTPAE